MGEAGSEMLGPLLAYTFYLRAHPWNAQHHTHSPSALEAGLGAY